MHFTPSSFITVGLLFSYNITNYKPDEASTFKFMFVDFDGRLAFVNLNLKLLSYLLAGREKICVKYMYTYMKYV